MQHCGNPYSANAPFRHPDEYYRDTRHKTQIHKLPAGIFYRRKIWIDMKVFVL